jgi:hypothetical protein
MFECALGYTYDTRDGVRVVAKPAKWAAAWRHIGCYPYVYVLMLSTRIDRGLPDDFDARSADELTLRKTDQIELVELDEGFGDGWFLGRHIGTAATGLFPGGAFVSPFVKSNLG